MEKEEKPQVYERYNYNGEFSLLVGERDLLVKALNRYKTLKKAAEALEVSKRTLYRMIPRHRITNREGVYSTANKWL